MIISHKHRYVFVQLPRTGTTSIGRELVEKYDGQRMRNFERHVTYDRFFRHATEEEKQYFVFSCIRNPLDKTASLYFKYKSDHHAYLDPKKKRRENILVGAVRKRQFKYVQKERASFASFLEKFFKLPYDDWSCLSHDKFDSIVRFENIDADFAEVLKKLNIEQEGSLPKSNRTAKDANSYLEVYTPDIRRHAMWIFAPYMVRWGYEFPPEWGETRVDWTSAAAHRLANAGRKVYWKYVR